MLAPAVGGGGGMLERGVGQVGALEVAPRHVGPCPPRRVARLLTRRCAARYNVFYRVIPLHVMPWRAVPCRIMSRPIVHLRHHMISYRRSSRRRLRRDSSLLIRVFPSESPHPSLLIRFSSSESLYPGLFIRVSSSKSLYPRHLIRVSPSESPHGKRQ